MNFFSSSWELYSHPFLWEIFSIPRNILYPGIKFSKLMMHVYFYDFIPKNLQIYINWNKQYVVRDFHSNFHEYSF